MIETQAPRIWRNESFMLNPNKNGYRPEPPVEQIPPSAKITCNKYDGTPDSYAHREVQNYSKMIEVGSGIIYQDTGTAI
jgi:hypothetical protein